MNYKLTNDPTRKGWLTRSTVEQANNQFHVIDIASALERLDRQENLDMALARDFLAESEPPTELWNRDQDDQNKLDERVENEIG